MIAYFDTSAFVKLIVAEPGSIVVGGQWRSADDSVSSVLLYPGACAAVARASRAGRLTDQQLSTAKRRTDVLAAMVTGIRPDDEVLRHGGDLAYRHGLRGYDAVHLASAVAVAPVRFVTADSALARAAAAEGLEVVVAA